MIAIGRSVPLLMISNCAYCVPLRVCFVLLGIDSVLLVPRNMLGTELYHPSLRTAAAPLGAYRGRPAVRLDTGTVDFMTGQQRACFEDSYMCAFDVS